MKTGTVWDTVGNTPLIRIKSLSESTGCHIYGKAEFLNPGGSVKDRAAKGIIHKAEQNGDLQPGGTIVEGTAGNTGIGIATLAAERGYKVIISMPDNQSEEKYQILRAIGAEVRAVPPCPFSDENHFYHQAKRIAASIENGFWADQFENTANAMMHYETTGPELWSQLEGNIDMVTLAVGTGGSMGGISRFLKEKNRNITIVAADPSGSGVYGYVKTGAFEGEGGSVTEGIGIKRLTANLDIAVLDDAVQINDHEMIDMLFHLARHDGLLLGTSSALNVFAAYKLALQHRGSQKNIVTLLCDHGSRYASRIFNETWLKSKDLHPKPLVA